MCARVFSREPCVGASVFACVCLFGGGREGGQGVKKRETIPFQTGPSFPENIYPIFLSFQDEIHPFDRKDYLKDLMEKKKINRKVFEIPLWIGRGLLSVSLYLFAF